MEVCKCYRITEYSFGLCSFFCYTAGGNVYAAVSHAKVLLYSLFIDFTSFDGSREIFVSFGL